MSSKKKNKSEGRMEINGEIKYGFDSSDYYWLLMLLSIQDDPIKFICEILQ